MAEEASMERQEAASIMASAAEAVIEAEEDSVAVDSEEVSIMASEDLAAVASEDVHHSVAVEGLINEVQEFLLALYKVLFLQHFLLLEITIISVLNNARNHICILNICGD